MSVPIEKSSAPGLYLVATPIGNLEDITLRAVRVLRQVDRIACEDTRQTQKLLNHLGLKTPTTSFHLFNEAARSDELIHELKAGGRIAVVSDAGTPGIADPGTRLVALAVAEGIPVIPVPGANAAINALIASGLPTGAFSFHGFLPSKPGQRKGFLEALPRGPATHILYESPHRLLETLADVRTLFGASQYVVVARELTKMYEEFLRGPVDEILANLQLRDSIRGEIVLLFSLEEATEAPSLSILEEVSQLKGGESMTEMQALKRVARTRGISKSEAYRELQREQARRG